MTLIIETANFIGNAGTAVTMSVAGGDYWVPVGVTIASTTANGMSMDALHQSVVVDGNVIGESGGIWANSGPGGTVSDAAYGGTGNDTMLGGSSDDTLAGGTGRDTLTGGVGADDFVFTSAAPAGLTAANRDTITDFTTKTDHIDLALIKAGQTFIGAAAFAVNGAAQVHCIAATGLLEGDTNGNGVADYALFLGVGTVLAATDLNL